MVRAYFAGGCEWRWPIFQPLDVQEQVGTRA
jgi:hypothetical protein